ncbi:MAG TPA: M48 family metallopeptidase [Roseiflexaceae bacterium]|nr:M48 family metallopeptidase [Roseiflexaceae bacterium]
MSSPTEPTITVDGVTLTLRIERKAVKHINARLRDGVLLVSAPARVPQGALDEAVVELARRLVRRQRARQINAEEDALALANRVAARFPQPIQVAQVLFVTNQEARWGSYSTATRTIRLNAALRTMPRWVLEAVVAHELAHAVHPDHSPQFWALLRSVAPDTDRADAFLEGALWLARRWDDLPPVERAILTREP